MRLRAPAVLVLHPNVAVLERSLRGRWSARFGARHWKLGGREICLPNVFTPHRPLFKLAWRMDAEVTPSPAVRRVAIPRELERFAGFVWIAWISLLVLLLDLPCLRWHLPLYLPLYVHWLEAGPVLPPP